MKRILVITEHYWPENFRINDLSDELASKGMIIDVLTGNPNYPEGKIYEGYSNWGWKNDNYKDVNILRVPIIPRGKGSAFALLLNYVSFVISASFRLIFLKKNYDHIFVFESSPITVCLPAIFAKKILRTKIPISMWVLDLWPNYFFDTLGIKKNRILGSILDSLCRFIYKNCDNILLQSEAFYEPVLRLVPDHKGLVFFPNWAEKIFEKNYEKNQLKRTKKQFLFAGNVGRLQNLEQLVHAIKTLSLSSKNLDKILEFVIVGDGSAKKPLETLVKESQLEDIIKFKGNLPLEDMPNLYQSADFLYISLIPGETFDKTIPGKLQSYMACGVPIVGFIGGETHKLLCSIDSNFVISSSDPNNLHGLIVRCLEMDEYTLEEYSRKLKEYYFNNFSRKKAVEECLRIFES